MLKLNVKELLQNKRWTRYQLYKSFLSTMSYRAFNDMIDSKTKSIKYTHLDILCSVFECDVSDLFVIDLEEKNME